MTVSITLDLNSTSTRIDRSRPARGAALCMLAAVATLTDRKDSFAAEAPERSKLQRMEALERANLIRSQRAQLKRDLRGGKLTIDGLLESPPEYLETAKVFDLLLAVPKYGRVKANKVLQQIRISPSKTVGGLSDRQRGELVVLLRSRSR